MEDLLLKKRSAVLKQGFTAKEFSYLVRRGDYFDYFKSNTDETNERDEIRDKLLNQIENDVEIVTHIFTTIKCVNIKNKTAYILEKIKADKSNFFSRISDDFILRKANQNIRKVYGIRQADRFKIIKNVQNILSENLPFYVCKTDIFNFYENINRGKIITDMKNSSLLSFETKCVINNLFTHNLFTSLKGLPRGINLSSTLSEYCMRKFDKDIQKIDGIFYYARYVDDIILFSTKEITKSTLNEIEKMLPDGLHLNMQKTKIQRYYDEEEIKREKIKDVNITISFLGYKFTKYIKNKKIAKFQTTIDSSKIKKIKERLIKAFLDFSKNKDFKLLKNRLLFLSANYPLKTTQKKLSTFDKISYLHGGIAYNYPLLDTPYCLKELDTFLHQVLFTSSFRKINSNFSETEKLELKKYSFYHGYQRRIIRTFKLNQLADIVKCWE